MKYFIYILSIITFSTSIVFAAVNTSQSNTNITIPTQSQVVDTVTIVSKPIIQSILDKVDAFRIEKKLYLEAQRDEIKNRIATQLVNTSKKVFDDTLGINRTDPATIGQTQGNNLGTPQDYILFTLYAGLATLFSNSFYFYAVCVVLAFSVVRILFRRAF